MNFNELVFSEAKSHSFLGPMLKATESKAREAGVSEWYNNYTEELKSQDLSEKALKAGLNMIARPTDANSLTRMATLDNSLQEEHSYKGKVALILEAVDGEKFGQAHVNHACFRMIQVTNREMKEKKTYDLGLLEEEKHTVGNIIRESMYTVNSLQTYADCGRFWELIDTKPLKPRGSTINNFRILGSTLTNSYGSYNRTIDVPEKTLDNLTCG